MQLVGLRAEAEGKVSGLQVGLTATLDNLAFARHLHLHQVDGICHLANMAAAPINVQGGAFDRGKAELAQLA